MSSSLDAVDHGILYHLQADAHQPITTIARALNVADNTVRNRIQKLEDQGVIRGYTIDVDYGEADIQHHYIFFCTARVSNRETLAEKAQALPGIVRVTTIMTGTQNIIIEGVAPTKNEITDIASELDELGLTIEHEHLIWGHFNRPYTGFRLDEDLSGT